MAICLAGGVYRPRTRLTASEQDSSIRDIQDGGVYRPRTRLTARVNPTIHGAMLRIGYAGDGGGGYSRVDPGGQLGRSRGATTHTLLERA